MKDCEHYPLAKGQACKDCAFVQDVTAECDRPTCGALLEPSTIDQYRAALDHWRHHTYLGGCSHGR